ncbi:MAG: hypothetical protein KAJ14_08700, partial [Candidatus Omnitrophica bacterium]|nr:hypothetical protein [Candidatus Omnitrophota bacterium]
ILYLNLIEKPFDQIEYNIISLSDRAEKQGVQSIEKYSIDSDLLGFHIAPSGKLISHVDGNDFMFNEALWPEEERMDITPILPKKNRSKNRENQVSNFNDSNDLSAISLRLANVIFSNAKINDILEESNSFNKLTEMPETVVDESIAILLSIDHEEVSEYLLEMKNTGRIKIIPNDKMFKDISNLIVKNKNNKCWLLIWEDIATKFSTLTVDIIIYMALKAYNEENIKLEESFVLAEKLVDNDGGRRTDDSSITERKKIVDIIAQEIAIAASCYHNSTIKITKLSIVDGYNTALVGKRQIEDGIVAAEIRLGINTLFLPDGQLAALIGHELGHIETGSFSFSFKENPILFIIGICSFLMIWVVPKPIDLICFIVACASFLLESVYSCYDLMGKEEAWQADTDRLGAIYASIAGYSPEEMLNYLSLKEKWDLFNLGRKLYQGRPFRRRKIKEVIDTLKQSGEIEYYRAIYLEKINEIQQGQPLDVQTKWSNEKRKGLDGGKGVVETSGKRGWLVVDKMVLTGWWDFTKVLNKIKLYRDIDLTKYGIEGVLNLSKSLESKTIEIIEDEEEVTENIDFDFSIEGNGNVLIEADTYRQLYLMYPDMVVYGILRQVLPYELRKLGIKDNIIKKIMVDNFGRSSVEEGALMTQLDDDLYLYKAAKCDVSHSDQKVLKILEARDKVLIDRFKTLIKELGGFERIFNMETSEFIVLLSEISNYTIKEITVTQIEDFIRVLSSKGWSFELIHYRGIPFSSKQYMAAYDDNVIKAFEDVYGQEAVAILGIGKGDDISFVKEYMDKECGFIKTPFLHEVLEKISLNYGLVDPLCAEVSGHSNLATIKATLYFAYHMNELKEVVDTIGLRGEAFSEAERRMRDSIIQLYENANEKLMKARAEKRINVFRDGGEKTGGVNGKVLMEEQSAWRRLVKDALDNCTLRSNEKYCKENHPDNFTTFIQRLKIGSHSGVLQNMLWLIEVDFSLFLEYKRITEELLPKVNDLLELYSNDIIVMEKFIKNRNVLVFWGRYVPFHTDKNVGIVPVNEIKKINGE